jgi:triphosphatase
MWRETDGQRAVTRLFEPDTAGVPRLGDDGALQRFENRIAPVRPQLVRMAAKTRPLEACGVLFALHANGIARNLQCVLTSIDPEGPHQLRVTLRRLRVALKVFRPVLRGQVRTELANGARELGAIVGELRDADVVIGELIAPHLDDFGAHPLSGALNNWRHEVRGRVRARLVAARASTFADALIAASTAAPKKKRPQGAANEFVASFLGSAWSQTAPRADRLGALSHDELHDFRKDTKALRYAIELESAFSGDRHTKVARSLKRIQDLLGHVNDVATLTQFNPPLPDGATLNAARARLIDHQHQGLRGKIEEAADEWRYLARHWRWKDETNARLL